MQVVEEVTDREEGMGGEHLCLKGLAISILLQTLTNPLIAAGATKAMGLVGKDTMHIEEEGTMHMEGPMEEQEEERMMQLPMQQPMEDGEERELSTLLQKLPRQGMILLHMLPGLPAGVSGVRVRRVTTDGVKRGTVEQRGRQGQPLLVVQRVPQGMILLHMLLIMARPLLVGEERRVILETREGLVPRHGLQLLLPMAELTMLLGLLTVGEEDTKLLLLLLPPLRPLKNILLPYYRPSRQ